MFHGYMYFCMFTAGLCQDCHIELVREEERQLLEYDSARIYVCKVSPKESAEGQSPAEAIEDITQGDDDHAPVNKRRKSELVDGQGGPQATVSPMDTKRVRRSQRHRKGRDEKAINVSSKQTLRDLKVQVRWKESQYVSIRTDMYRYIQICTKRLFILCSYNLSWKWKSAKCIDTYRYVSIRTGMYRYVPVRTDTFQCVWYITLFVES